MFTARVHEVYTAYKPCTRPVQAVPVRPCTACTRAVNTAVYTCKRPCAWPFTGGAHGLEHGRVRVDGRVYGPCTRPIHGRVQSVLAACTGDVHGRTRVPVACLCTRPCIRPCTRAVYASLRPVCSAVQMGRKEGHVHDRVHGRVHRPWLCTGRVHGGVHGHRVHVPYMAVNTTMYTARIRP